jgi:hypothetical protein
MRGDLLAPRHRLFSFFAALAFLAPSVITRVRPALWQKRGGNNGRLIRRELHAMNIAHAASLLQLTRGIDRDLYGQHFVRAAALLSVAHLREFTDMLRHSDSSRLQKMEQLASAVGCAYTAAYFWGVQHN